MALQLRLHSLKCWLANIWNWLAEARHFWLFCLLSLLTAVVIVLMGGSELAFRVAGMLFQLLGVLTVLLGTEETRKLFGLPSLTFMLRQWLRRFPRFKPRYVASVTSANLGQSTRGRGHTVAPIDPDATLEQRVELLERNTLHLKNMIFDVQRELEQAVQTISNSVEEERSARVTENQKILLKLETTETGGLHISAIGAIWILFGVVFSSVPKEPSSLFS